MNMNTLKVTKQINWALQQNPQLQTQQFYDYIHNAISHYYQQLTIHRSKGATSMEIANGVYTLINEIINLIPKENSDKFSCTKGCNHCCHIPVSIVKSEAETIYQYCLDNNISIDWEKAKRQVGWNEKEYSATPKPESACVLLKDGICSVYDQRPVACRKYFVYSPPEECDAQTKHADTVASYVSIDMELVASALANFETQGNLPEMLLKVHAERSGLSEVKTETASLVS